MKKVFFVLMALCLVSSLAFAAESTATTATKDTTAATTVAVTTAATTASAAVTTATPVVVAEPAAAAVSEVMLNGVIVDNTCVAANKDNMAEYVKTHAKECALKPGCIESGYSIFADGKVYAFDTASSAKVVGFLKQADSKLQVAITAKQVGDELSLVSIENQK
ncbi:MAG: hypothetical protein NT014_04715 [Candidatus Omnitrophica bacterium]|nr:hypothetical protein [Candidatus Omnitrophota bacterium]